MEVGGNNKQYPGRNLSNFFPHPFTFRGIEVASMEGFLQGMKFKSPEMQREVFKLVGVCGKKPSERSVCGFAEDYEESGHRKSYYK